MSEPPRAGPKYRIFINSSQHANSCIFNLFCPKPETDRLTVMSTQIKTAISTKEAPAAIGPYSQAIRVGDTLFASGQIPLDPATGQMVSGGITEQTVRVLENVKAILAEAGLRMHHVVKTTVFLKSMSDFAAMNE